MITLAFYKGEGDISDKLVRLWTRSKYSHAELIIDGLWYSSSPREGKVRAKIMQPKKGNWDYIHFYCTKEQRDKAKELFYENLNLKYDWLGIFCSQFIPLGVDSDDRWFCSEICADALHYAGLIRLEKPPSWYSPNRLFDKSVFCGIAEKG